MPVARARAGNSLATGAGHRHILLYEARAKGGLKVVACSNIAASAGVRRNMPLAEALVLVEGNARSHRSDIESEISSRMLVEVHDTIGDRQALEELAVWCQQFSPMVSLEDAPRPDSLLLDLTGIGPLFGGEAALVNRIEQAFAERRLTSRIAIAETIGAAWALAHYAESRKSEIGNRHQDAAAPSQSSRRLRFNNQAPQQRRLLVDLTSLPVAALRLAAETVARLEELGIDRIEQLLQLPRETLSSRFGFELLLRLDQAMGLVPEAVVTHKPPPEFEVEWLLEHATDRQEMLDFVLESLVARLAHQLAARREGVLRLEGGFDLQPGLSPFSMPAEKRGTAPPCVRFSVGLFRASAAPEHLLGLVRLRLEKLRLPAAVTAIRLTAAATGPLEMEQHALFVEKRDRASPRHLAALVDRLASRLGRNAVLQPQLLADAQPEHACQYLPLAGRGRESVSQKTRSRGSPSRIRESRRDSSTCSPLRPLQLIDPVPLQVIAVVPEGPPICFRAAGCEQRVVNVWGPERIETGWWRKRGVRRDYYRVETHTGQRFWLFRRLADQRWFWHGVFE